MIETWFIIGASSQIARAFCKELATCEVDLVLIGRDKEELTLNQQDLIIRYGLNVSILTADLSCSSDTDPIIKLLQHTTSPVNLFLAQSVTDENDTLTSARIETLIQCNITANAKLIHAFSNHGNAKTLVYLSSVAGDRGRCKNSLYGASKAAIDIYMEGLRVSHPQLQLISLKLGFIDTRQTFGKPGIFLAAKPEKVAKKIITLINKKRISAYFPFFWQQIMWVIRLIPKKLFYRLSI